MDTRERSCHAARAPARAAPRSRAPGAIIDGFLILRPLGISMGDPTGIGPEVIVRAFTERPDLDAIVYGDAGALERAVPGLRLPARVRVVSLSKLTPEEAPPGQPNELCGRAQVDYLAAATKAAIAGEVSSLVTAPISKEWAAKGGFKFPGHTEYLAQAAGVSEFAMMLVGPKLRVTLATIHIPLREVASKLTVNAIAEATLLTARSLRRDFDLPLPRVAVAGLNPHGGENGQLGDEEKRIVTPAIELAQRRLSAASISARISGPHVPDVVFRQALDGQFDAVVALYHDQAFIPVKLLQFDDAVNLTLGLPFVRTSPDHGTAYDIAGTGKARPGSMLAAMDLAIALAQQAAARIDQSDRIFLPSHAPR